MNTPHYYEVDVEWQQQRKGIMSSPVLATAIEVATPPEFTNGMPGLWSPEHLLAAAVNSCLMTTFLAIAENSGLEYLHFKSHAVATLDSVDGKLMITEVLLQPTLTLADEKFREKALRILTKSEANCLISNSVKARIKFEPQVLIAIAEETV